MLMSAGISGTWLYGANDMERNKSETNAPANAVRVPHRDHDLLNQPLLN